MSFLWKTRRLKVCADYFHFSKAFVSTVSPSQRALIWDETVEPGGQNVELRSRHDKFLTWYACGPTVYDAAHIGHASCYIQLDIIRRILERQGFTILQVMGVTDIDDKIIARAQATGTNWRQLGNTYELEFFRDLQTFNVKPPHVKGRVSEFIPRIVTFVEHLITSKFAYVTPDGSVYFDKTKYPNSGIFRQSRTEPTQTPEPASKPTYKKNPQDFALWKGVKPGEPYWDTPWGKGRPGWHIECSVIASHFFGPTLDIHSGGMDLTFPHHENEETQCCARFSRPKWVSHWIHTGHLHLTGDVKMSKSIGNTVSIAEFLTKNSPAVLRMLCVMKKYYTNIEYCPESELHAKSILQRLHTFLADTRAVLLNSKPIRWKGGHDGFDLWTKLVTARNSIQGDLLNNFDTPSALLKVMDLVAEFYRSVELEEDDQGIDLGLVLGMMTTIEDFYVLTGFSESAEQSANSNQLLEPLLKHSLEFRCTIRDLALDRNKKDIPGNAESRKGLMAACDNFRDNLGHLGIEVKDHHQTSSWSMSERTTR